MSLIGTLPLTLFSFVFLISIVVVIHELGHYWAGRWCGVHAEAFSVGFGPTLVSWRDKHGTVWRIAALPLGGYVKFLGDAGAASEPDADKLDAMRARMGPDAEKCYHFKPVWQRAIVTAAGPIANFILAIAIFSALALSFGSQPYLPPVVGAVAPDSAAEEAGFQPMDEVVSINGKAVDSFQDIPAEIVWRPGELLDVTVMRDGSPVMLRVAARAVEVEDRFGGTRTMGQLGLNSFQLPVIRAPLPDSAAAQAGFESGDRILSVNGEDIRGFHEVDAILAGAGDAPLEFIVQRGEAQTEIVVTPTPAPEGMSRDDAATVRLGLISVGGPAQRDHFNPITAIGYGMEQTWAAVSTTGRYVGRVVTGRVSPELLNGPLGIATTAGQTALSSVEAGSNAGESTFLLVINLIYLAGFLSVGLGLVNLLPIPILDGGHLVYYAYEAVARRPLSMKAQALGFRVGLALVLGMMLVATWNDLNYLLGQIF